MAKSFKLKVITPSHSFYEGQAEMVIARTLDGYEGFMANHTWIVELLDIGELWIKESGNAKFKVAAISNGFIDVTEDIIVYSDDAVWSEEINISDVNKVKEEALKCLEDKESMDVFQIENAFEDIKKAENKLKAIDDGKRGTFR